MPERTAAEAAMARLERRVAAQEAALRRVPEHVPLPPEVVALLAVAPTELDGTKLPPQYLPRLTAVHQQVQSMVDAITLREHAVQDRLASIRSARRAGPPARLVDCLS